jgi:hypothetical protein
MEGKKRGERKENGKSEGERNKENIKNNRLLKKERK